METTKKTNNNIIKDIMIFAAMFAIAWIISSVLGTVVLSIPAVYLYGSAGLVGLINAIFFLIVANKINRHGILFIWALLNGIIY